MRMNCTVRIHAQEIVPEGGLVVRGELILPDNAGTINVLEPFHMKTGDMVIVGPMGVDFIVDMEVKAVQKDGPAPAGPPTEPNPAGPPTPRRVARHTESGK